MKRTSFSFFIFWIVSLLGGENPFAQGNQSLISGLDHIPVAVRNLEEAAGRYRHLGFALKPGRPHSNGIRNQHIKFADGTEIELITAAVAVDGLTHEYLQHILQGDGPAFLGLYAPDRRKLANLLKARGWRFNQQAGMVTFTENSHLRPLFFAGRNQSPTDLPEHFRHPNGAVSLFGVWLAGDETETMLAILKALDIGIAEKRVWVPNGSSARVAELLKGEIVFLPKEHRLQPSRPIVGATLLVRDLRQTHTYFENHFLEQYGSLIENAKSIFIPPAMAHGMWLEFREIKK